MGLVRPNKRAVNESITLQKPTRMFMDKSVYLCHGERNVEVSEREHVQR